MGLFVYCNLSWIVACAMTHDVHVSLFNHQWKKVNVRETILFMFSKAYSSIISNYVAVPVTTCCQTCVVTLSKMLPTCSSALSCSADTMS